MEASFNHPQFPIPRNLDQSITEKLLNCQGAKIEERLQALDLNELWLLLHCSVKDTDFYNQNPKIARKITKKISSSIHPDFFSAWFQQEIEEIDRLVAYEKVLDRHPFSEKLAKSIPSELKSTEILVDLVARIFKNLSSPPERIKQAIAEKKIFKDIFDFPKNLDPKIIKKIDTVTNSKALIEVLNLEPEEVLQFLYCSIYDLNYFERNKKLLIQLWKHVKSSPYEQAIIEKYFPPYTILRSDSELKIDLFPLFFLDSDFFKNQFYTKLGQNTTLKLNLSNLHPTSQDIVIDFILHGQLQPLSEIEIASEVLTTCLEIDLKEIIEPFTNECLITPENAFTYYGLADFYNLDQLKSKILMFLKEHLNDPFLAKAIYKEAKNENFEDVAIICKNYFIERLVTALKILAEDVDGESNPAVDQAHILIHQACKALGGIPEESLEKLSMPELKAILRLFPDNIRHLNLSVYTDKEIAKLVDLLPPDLIKLDLTNAAISGKTMDKIAKRCKSLEVLILAGVSKWNKKDLFKPYLENWRGLLAFKKLKIIDVTSCDDAAPHLEEILKSNAENLEVLKMGRCQLTQTSWKLGTYEFSVEEFFCNRCISILASKGKKLRELDVSDHDLSGNCLDQLYLNDAIYRSLEVLSLANVQTLNEFELSGIGAKFRHLRSLNLAGIKNLNSKILKEILTYLGGYPDEEIKVSRLRELDLTNVFDDFELLRFLNSSLMKLCPNIEVLHYTNSLDTSKVVNLSGRSPLTYLSVGHGYSSSIPTPSRMPELKIVDIKNIEKFNFEELINFPKLKTLKSQSRGHEIERIYIKYPELLKKLTHLSLPCGSAPKTAHKRPSFRKKNSEQAYRNLFASITQVKTLELFCDALPYEQVEIISLTIIEKLKNLQSLTLLGNITGYNGDRNYLNFLRGAQSLINLHIGFKRLEIDQETLIMLLQNNPRLKNVYNLIGTKKWRVDMIRAPNGEPLIKVLANSQAILDEQIKFVSSNYPVFKIIGEVYSSREKLDR